MTLLLALFIACADPAKNVAPAEVAAPAAPTAPVEAAAPAAPQAPRFPGLALSPSGTIGFTGAKITKSHSGEFGTWTGQLWLDGEAVSGLNFEVTVASLKTDAEKLDNHLRSPDFFDVEKWPTARFQSTAIAAGAPADSKLEGANSTVTGDLSIRDVTRTVTFPAVITVSATGVNARTEFYINRQDFGIVYPGKPDDLIKDEVVLRADLTAPRG